MNPNKILIKTIQDVVNNSELIPVVALEDINRRIADWLASGGDIEDNYIKQQIRYAELLVNEGLRKVK